MVLVIQAETAMLPATAASTAATAGPVRLRCRDASRVASRRVNGRRRARCPAAPTTAGAHTTNPISATTAPASTSVNRAGGWAAYAAAPAPVTIITSPATGRRRAVATTPRRPVRAATTASRPAARA